MSEQLEYTYKLYKDSNGELVVTVNPLVQDIEKSIQAMMDMNVDTLSDDNKHLFEMKILGLRTIHQFLGALQQEQFLKDYKQELAGSKNIETSQVVESITKGAIH